MNSERLKTLCGAVFVGGCILFVLYGVYVDRRELAALEKRFEMLVEKAARERNVPAGSRPDQVSGTVETQEFKIGKVLPILIKDGNASLSPEVLRNLPEDRRPSTPEEVQTLLFIEYAGRHETSPVPGITTHHSSVVHDFGFVLVDISHPQLESPQERAETAATLVEEVPVDDIVEFLSATQSFQASPK